MARPDVSGGAIVSGDGLVIEASLDPGVDAEAVAALATTLTRHQEEIGSAAALGSTGPAVLDFDGGAALVSGLRDGASLILLTPPGSDLGEVLYFLRRQRGAIADLL